MRTLSKPIGTIFVLISIFLFSQPAQAKYGGGSGTADDPYQIATAKNLNDLGESPEDYNKHFILTDNIDLDPNLPGRKVFDKAVIAPDVNETTEWWRFDGTPFTGLFDGNGHTISHLTIKGGGSLGLFGQLGWWDAPGGEVKNLGLVDVNIIGSGYYVGGLVGFNGNRDRPGGVLANCYTGGAVSGHSSVGGLVGWNEGTVSQSYSTGVVGGEYDIGGLVGGNYEGSITTSYSTTSVSGETQVGGLVGQNVGHVTQCYSTGAVSGTGQYVGGLLGTSAWPPDVTASFWDIQTSGQTKSAGGLGLATDQMQRASTFSCWGPDGVWTINEGKDYPRLWWENAGGQRITRVYSYGGGSGSQVDPYLIYTADQLNMIGLIACDWDKAFKVMADIDVSGFDGKDGRPGFNIIGPAWVHFFDGYVDFWETPFTGVFNGNGHTISHLTVTLDGASGGLFGGLASPAVVRNLGVLDVNITGSGDCVGGVVGWNHSSVTNCYSTGTVSGTSNVGGLVGSNYDGNVTQCYSAGAVSGTGGYVGGLVGRNGFAGKWYWVPGSVSQCYSTGPVSGRWAVGGLVGENSRGSVTACYSIGAVTGDEGIGGLVGATQYGVSDPNNFWDTQTSGQAKSAGGTGKTTAEMQTAGTFLEAGWDFVNVWGIGENQTYPYLRKYSAADINQDASVNFLDLVVLAENWLAEGQ